MMRIGQGFDVHAFGAGDHVVLGGVRIAAQRGVVAHSDGDVVIHALCDAILGALALGDIGTHFPPTDERWRGADSRHVPAPLRRADARSTATRSAMPTSPSSASGRKSRRMRRRCARILPPILVATCDKISVKATTSEKLGFTGRGEGIAALAVVLLVAAS